MAIYLWSHCNSSEDQVPDLPMTCSDFTEQYLSVESDTTSNFTILIYHDDVIKWKHFPRYWPFVRGIHRSPVNSPDKGQWLGALMFSLLSVWINGWVNNREAVDLRRYRGNYDVTVISIYAIQYNRSLYTLFLFCCAPVKVKQPSRNRQIHQGTLLLTWINFIPSMEK